MITDGIRSAGTIMLAEVAGGASRLSLSCCDSGSYRVEIWRNPRDLRRPSRRLHRALSRVQDHIVKAKPPSGVSVVPVM
jgi:hypothetical protein